MNYFCEIQKSAALGTITGMLINLTPEFSDAYIYTDATEKDSKKAILKYCIGNQDWEEITDDSYPYEFSIHLTDPTKKINLKWISEDINGVIQESGEFLLSN